MKKRITIISLAVTTFILAVLAISISQNNRLDQVKKSDLTPSIIPTQTFKTFKSSNVMDFTVQIPNYYQAMEKLTYVDFSKDNLRINVSKNNSNYSNLVDYLKWFDGTRKGLQVNNEKNIEIGGYEGILRIENFSLGLVNQQKIYYLLVNGVIYTLSTSSPLLYPDLDQIAQSFRYTP